MQPIFFLTLIFHLGMLDISPNERCSKVTNGGCYCKAQDGEVLDFTYVPKRRQDKRIKLYSAGRKYSFSLCYAMKCSESGAESAAICQKGSVEPLALYNGANFIIKDGEKSNSMLSFKGRGSNLRHIVKLKCDSTNEGSFRCEKCDSEEKVFLYTSKHVCWPSVASKIYKLPEIFITTLTVYTLKTIL